MMLTSTSSVSSGLLIRNQLAEPVYPERLVLSGAEVSRRVEASKKQNVSLSEIIT